MIQRFVAWAFRAWRRKFISWHFALFLLPWLFALAVPPLRLILTVQATNTPLGGVVGIWTPGQYTKDPEASPFSAQRIFKSHPGNLNA